jgi:hypothetical protein
VIDLRRAMWRKSTRSQQSGQCVELARIDGLVGIRDSKEPDGPVLVFTTIDFAAFLEAATNGEFDGPP